MKFGPKPETVASLRETATSSATWIMVSILCAGAMVMFGLFILAGAVSGQS